MHEGELIIVWKANRDFWLVSFCQSHGMHRYKDIFLGLFYGCSILLKWTIMEDYANFYPTTVFCSSGSLSREARTSLPGHLLQPFQEEHQGVPRTAERDDFSSMSWVCLRASSWSKHHIFTFFQQTWLKQEKNNLTEIAYSQLWGQCFTWFFGSSRKAGNLESWINTLRMTRKRTVIYHKVGI